MGLGDCQRNFLPSPLTPPPGVGNFLLCRLLSAAALNNRHAWCFSLPDGNHLPPLGVGNFFSCHFCGRPPAKNDTNGVSPFMLGSEGDGSFVVAILCLHYCGKTQKPLAAKCPPEKCPSRRIAFQAVPLSRKRQTSGANQIENCFLRTQEGLCRL